MLTEHDLLLPIRSSGSRTPLFCVHPISGSAYPYLEFGRQLMADQPVYALEAPGFDTMTAPARSIRELATQHTDILTTANGGHPACLLGWSFGGLVAHEMAIMLQEAGIEVPVLVLVDSFPPDPAALPHEAALAQWFLTDLLRGAGLTGDEASTITANLRTHNQQDVLLAAATDATSPLADVEQGILRRRLGVFAAHVTALREHRPSGSLRGRLLYVQASESAQVSAFWRGLGGQVTTRTVPGDHYSIWGPEHLPALVAAVTSCLDSATAA